MLSLTVQDVILKNNYKKKIRYMKNQVSNLINNLQCIYTSFISYEDTFLYPPQLLKL